MKTIALISFFLMLPLTTCQQKQSQEPGPSSITYTALSRGSYWKITATADSVMVNKDREGDALGMRIKTSQWQKVQSLAKEIDLGTIADLDPPSNKRAFDGAAMATLEIEKGKSYSSPTFDHGNPPDSLRKLVDYLLTLSESIE
tara:strand:- start:92130 stop:92561 length:432 start_codon:yes stop_codon:yes gene_type:complete